ncbi:hypothetical protein [Pseudalgibacter alginicilyticus]|nr:hypothetical protein [Pseudalgibacter alginicilyticus]
MFIKSLFTAVMLLFYSVSFSQGSTNDSKPFILDFVSGVSYPLGDFKSFSETGFKSGLVVNKKFCNNISVGFNTNYTALPIKSNIGVSNEKWHAFSLGVGPQYQIDINKVFVQFYGHLGVSFLDIPEVIDFYPQTDLVLTSLKEANSSGLNTRLGINIGAEICKGLRFFVSTEYTTSYNGHINYQIKDVTNAIDDGGNINADIVNNIPFENKDFSFSTMNIQFGIRLDLGNTNQKATSHNASRSNRSNNIKHDDSDEDSGIGQLEGHSANISGRINSVNDNPNDDLDGEDDNIAKATSHNASRSNRSNNIKHDDFDEDSDSSAYSLSVLKVLVEMDINRDRKISKLEAKGDLKETFEKRDVNKDGYLTENELKAKNQ